MASQVLLNPVGSGGDVFPFLPIGMELQKRGHHVALMTNPIFQESAGHANVEFIKIGTRESIKDLGNSKSEPAWKTALRWGTIGTMQESFDVIQQRSKLGQTIILSSPLAFGARLAAEKFDLPLVSLLSSPYVIRSEFDSPVTKPLFLPSWMPRMFKRIQYWFADRFFIDPEIKNEMGSIPSAVHLPGSRRFFHRWFLSPDLVLGLFPDFYAQPQPDWPKQIRLLGPVVWDPPTDDFEKSRVLKFLNNEKAIVVVGGSIGIGDQDFYPKMVLASQKLKRKLVILEHNPNVIPKPLAKHVIHSSYFPLDGLLDTGRIVVHTGSIGATMRSLNAGALQLVIPSVNDQHDNANRVVRLNFGKRIARNPEPDKIVEMVRQLEASTICRNEIHARTGFINTNQSVHSACDLIENVFQKKYKT